MVGLMPTHEQHTIQTPQKTLIQVTANQNRLNIPSIV